MTVWALSRRLHLLLVASLAAILFSGAAVFAILLATLLLLLARRPEALRPLRSRGFLILTATSFLFGLFVLGPEPFRPSEAGARLGAVLAVRAAIVLTLARWVSLDASPFEFAALGGRRGAAFGFALGIALNALPALEDSARRTWDALRVRGGTRRHRLRNARRFALATLANALRRADATAEVALSRGYSLDRLSPENRPEIPSTIETRAVLLAADLALVAALLIRLRR